MVKRGIFFSLDALIAVLLLLGLVGIITTVYVNVPRTPQPSFIASDVAQILATISLSELDDPRIDSLLNAQGVTDLNRTILEQVLRFQVDGNEASATQLLNFTLGQIIPATYHAGVWIEGYDDAMYSTASNVSYLNASQLTSAKQLVSGIEKNKVVEGSTARALLANINEQASTVYVYFGGYEGDGNITKKITLPTYTSITNTSFEIDAGGPFDVYINGQYAAHFIPTLDGRPDEFDINSTSIAFLTSGENTIQLVFTGSAQYIAGGFMRVRYMTNDIASAVDLGMKTEYFPGIEGPINVYSSFFVPGNVSTMSLFLHYLTNHPLFVTIGNTTVFESNASTEQSVTIDSATLAGKLDYVALSDTTVPLRIGLVGAQGTPGGSGAGGITDAILVTDASQSMAWCADVAHAQSLVCNYDCAQGGSKSCAIANASQCVGHPCGGNCGSPSGHYLTCEESNLDIAKIAAKEFVNTTLSTDGNNVGLVSYGTSTHNRHQLSTNMVSLYSQINSYSADGLTCICCGIDSAQKLIDQHSSAQRQKSMLVMSHGTANVGCDLASIDHDGDGSTNNDPQDQAIEAACRAYAQSNITVHTIGFGNLSTEGKTTLQLIAACANGQYYEGNITTLAEMYQQIAQQMITVTFSLQTANATGVISKLFSDSALIFTYGAAVQSPSFGAIPLSVESARFGNNLSEYSITIPNNVQVSSARVTSYSGNAWADSASVRTGSDVYAIYSLASYAQEYLSLGDPYSVYIPASRLQPGTHTIHISNGITAQNSTGGSPDSRLIYTASVSLSANNSAVFSAAEGCTWTLSFEDGTVSTVPIPSSYIGPKICVFTDETMCSTDYGTDAINNAVCQLFSQFDIDGNGRLFITFTASDISIDTTTIGKIPYLWGPTIVEVRVWR